MSQTMTLNAREDYPSSVPDSSAAPETTAQPGTTPRISTISFPKVSSVVDQANNEDSGCVSDVFPNEYEQSSTGHLPFGEQNLSVVPSITIGPARVQEMVGELTLSPEQVRQAGISSPDVSRIWSFIDDDVIEDVFWIKFGYKPASLPKPWAKIWQATKRRKRISIPLCLFVLVALITMILVLVLTTKHQSRMFAATCNNIASGHDYLEYKGRCFILFDTFATPTLNWDNAMTTCSELFQGRLAYIDHADTYDDIKNWLDTVYRPLKNWCWWAGLFQVDTSDEPKGGWAWVNANHTANHWANGTRWHSDEPNNGAGTGDENCAPLCYWNYDSPSPFSFNDEVCDNKYPAICEAIVTTDDV